MQKLFVWDFHGTLEKGNEFGALDISNKALKKLGFKQRFTKQHAVELYGKKWYEYFEFLLPDETHETHLLLQQTCFEWPDAEKIVLKYIQQNDHAHEVLQAIQDAGHMQIVISNTSTEALPIFLRLVEIEAFFSDGMAFAVMAHAREATRTKEHVVADYLATLSFEPSLVVIGDSEKDMALAQRFGAKGYWYRHPHHPIPEVVRDDPKLVVTNDLRQVLAEI